MSAYKAVMFDCDGVLVDSEQLIAEVLTELAVQHGATDLRGGADLFRGRHLTACIDLIGKQLGRPLPAAFAAMYRSRCEAVFTERLRPVDGVCDVLAALRVPYCVVSNSSAATIIKMLDKVGLLGHFTGRMYSAMDCAKPKPAPEVYLRAATGLRLPAASCVAVEDSEVGVRAAAAAGMAVIGLSKSQSARLRAAGATWTRATMFDVRALLLDLTKPGVNGRRK